MAPKSQNNICMSANKERPKNWLSDYLFVYVASTTSMMNVGTNTTTFYETNTESN